MLLLLINPNPLLYFCRRLPKAASCKVSLNLDWQFQRRWFLKQNRKLAILLLLLLINCDPLYFCRGSSKEASCKVSLNLDWQFQEMFFKARTTDKDKSQQLTMSTWCSGELKNRESKSVHLNHRMSCQLIIYKLLQISTIYSINNSKVYSMKADQ